MKKEFKRLAKGFVCETGFLEASNGQRVIDPKKPAGENLEVFREEDAVQHGGIILGEDYNCSTEEKEHFRFEREFTISVPAEIEGTAPHEKFNINIGQNDMLMSMLGISEDPRPVIPQNSNAMEYALENGLITITDHHFRAETKLNSIKWFNILTPDKKLRIKRLYATSTLGVFENIKPEVYRFNAQGDRLLNIGTPDKKAFRERSKMEQNNLVHHIENLNILLDGKTVFNIQVAKGETVTIHLSVEGTW